MRLTAEEVIPDSYEAFEHGVGALYSKRRTRSSMAAIFGEDAWLIGLHRQSKD